MASRYPCKLSYCIEHQIEVLLTCELAESLPFALDRFVQDEERFRMGLMARLATADADELYIGYNANSAAACIGYLRQLQTEESRPLTSQYEWARGVGVKASWADFHWFVPDCPSSFLEEYLLPFPVVRNLVLMFMESGEWPPGVEWVVDRGRGQAT